jgi:exodeoxyribonuclease VII small subunit
MAHKRNESEEASSREPGIDELLDRLEAVVGQLEAGDLPLERALERFEEGIRLTRRSTQLLDGIDERIERLLAERDQAVPFDESTNEGDDKR